LCRQGRVTYGGEAERVDFYAERRNVLLLELARQMALDEGRLCAVSTGAVMVSYERIVYRSLGLAVSSLERNAASQ
jgi:hypothetical protein